MEDKAKQIFNDTVQGKYDIREFIQWNCLNHDTGIYTEQSDAVKSVIEDSVQKDSFISNPYSKGLAITINYRNCKHSPDYQLLANPYEPPLRQILHTFKDAFMHHSRLICLGCFESDCNKT